MGKMKALRWWWWANLPNRHCSMVVDNSWMTTSKWKDNEVVIEEARERPANSDVIVGGFGEK
jgi:hypothetical protein